MLTKSLISEMASEIKDLRIENKELGQALKSANADIDRKDGLIEELATALSHYIDRQSEKGLLDRAQTEIEANKD
jgi:hypothetical protein